MFQTTNQDYFLLSKGWNSLAYQPASVWKRPWILNDNTAVFYFLFNPRHVLQAIPTTMTPEKVRKCWLMLHELSPSSLPVWVLNCWPYWPGILHHLIVFNKHSPFYDLVSEKKLRPPTVTKKHKAKLLYFVWSPPWHLYILLLANLLAFYLTYFLAFYLACLLAFYLAYLLADVLAYLLADVLAYLLAYLLAYVLAYLLAFHLAFYLAYLLAYYLANLLAFHLAFYLAYLLAYYLANLLAFYRANILALYLAYLLAF